MTVQEFQQWDTNKDGYITAQEIQMLWSHLGPFKGLKD
ncbi:MAG: EF-hand domain-containing protein [Candidatus Hydrogenedens sp.]